jgi:hypothetical protein
MKGANASSAQVNVAKQVFVAGSPDRPIGGVPRSDSSTNVYYYRGGIYKIVFASGCGNYGGNVNSFSLYFN